HLHQRTRAPASRPTRARPKTQAPASRPTRARPKTQAPASRPTRVRPKTQAPASRPTRVRPKTQAPASRPTRVRPKTQAPARKMRLGARGAERRSVMPAITEPTMTVRQLPVLGPDGQWMLSVLAKRTYRLFDSGRCVLAEEQLPLQEEILTDPADPELV